MDADQPMEQVVAPPQEETIYQLPGVVLWMGSQQVGAGILTVTTKYVVTQRSYDRALLGSSFIAVSNFNLVFFFFCRGEVSFPWSPLKIAWAIC
jgi:hypothetical protein